MSELQTFRRSYIPPLPTILTKDVNVKKCEALGAAADHGMVWVRIFHMVRENSGFIPLHLRTSSCRVWGVHRQGLEAHEHRCGAFGRSGSWRPQRDCRNLRLHEEGGRKHVRIPLRAPWRVHRQVREDRRQVHGPVPQHGRLRYDRFGPWQNQGRRPGLLCVRCFAYW